MLYLIYVGVPVLVVLGLRYRAVDSGEEGGLGEVQQRRVQVERLGNHRLDSLAYISNGDEQQTDESEIERSDDLRPSVSSLQVSVPSQLQLS